MSGKKKVVKGRGRGRNTHAVSSSSPNVGSVGARPSSSICGTRHVPSSTSSSCHVPASSSISKPDLSISSGGRVTLDNTAIVDWLAGSRSSQQEDSDDLASSQVSLDSRSSTVPWHGDSSNIGISSVSIPSSMSSLPLPSGKPSFLRVLRDISSGAKEDTEQHSDDDDLFSASQPTECVAAVVEVEAVTETHSCGSGGVGGGSRGGRRSNEGGHGARHDVTSHSQHSDRSGGDDEEGYDDDVVLDRTWEPGDEVMTASEEEGSSGGTGCDKQPSRGRGRSQSAKRCSGRVSSGAGDGDTDAGVGSRKKPARQGASSGGCGGGGGGGRGTTSLRYSAVWQFFCTFPEEENMAQCRICKQKVRRGQGSNVGTTALRKHMERHHKAMWDNQHAPPSCTSNEDPSSAAAAAPSPCHLSSSQALSTMSLSSSSSLSSSAPPMSRQLSITESLSNKQQYIPSHPLVVRLNSHLAKLLVVQSLPYHLVDSAGFKQLMACAQPRWRIPSRHYFSKTAVPALHKHVEEKVSKSLQLSVCSRVHATVDTWSSNYGQGQYMSFTAHWVNILQSDAPPQQCQALPPPRLYVSSSTPDTRRLPSFSSYSSSSSLPSSLEVFPSPTGHSVSSTPPPSSFHRCKVKRHNAVLHLLSLGEKSHTGQELLLCIKEEIARWLSPLKLTLGNVVSDNGKNVVAALRLGHLTHAPCMAHVINLVITRFLKSYVGLKGVLAMSRRVCVRFRRSYAFKHALLDLQRQNNLPEHSLICDVPTRWNSTLHMLDRLYEQRKAVNDFLMQQTGSVWSQCNFELRHWQLVRDACRVLRPFEEATRFVSRDASGMNDVMPLIFIMEQTLTAMIQQRMEEGSHLAMDVEEEEEDEETGPEEELDLEMESQEGIGDEAAAQHDSDGGDDESDDDLDDGQPWQYGAEMEPTGPSETLARMASCMLRYLRADCRIVSMKQRDDYWIATLLDPRYKARMGEFFAPSEREAKLAYYREKLCSQLVMAFKRQTPAASMSDRGATLRSPLSHRSTASGRATSAIGGSRGSSGSSSSSSSQFSLENMMTTFLHPIPRPDTHRSTSHQRDVHHLQVQHLNNQVHSYLDCALSPSEMLIPDPMDFWVSRLDHWQELAQFAMGVLSCPPSSVASERVFSAAGGFVTPKRTRLSANSLENLTFLKMNQAWIGEDFKTPVPDATD